MANPFIEYYIVETQPANYSLLRWLHITTLIYSVCFIISSESVLISSVSSLGRKGLASCSSFHVPSTHAVSVLLQVNTKNIFRKHNHISHLCVHFCICLRKLSYLCDSLIGIYLYQELANLSYKGPDGKYFSFADHKVCVTSTTQLCHCRMKADINST